MFQCCRRQPFTSPAIHDWVARDISTRLADAYDRNLGYAFYMWPVLQVASTVPRAAPFGTPKGTSCEYKAHGDEKESLLAICTLSAAHPSRDATIRQPVYDITRKAA